MLVIYTGAKIESFSSGIDITSSVNVNQSVSRFSIIIPCFSPNTHLLITATKSCDTQVP